MKIYTNTFNMNQRGNKKFYVPQWSQFKIGIQVKENGQLVSSTRIKLYDGTSEIAKDNELYNDYILFTRNSTNSTTKSLTVKVDNSEKFELLETVTDSTVYDIDATGTQYVLPVASETVLGGVKVGDNLSISEDGVLSAAGGSEYVLPVATTETLGGVKVDGNTIFAFDDGKIEIGICPGALVTQGDGLSTDAESKLTLAPATADKLGGVKVGEGLSISEDGTLSVDGDDTVAHKAVSQSSDKSDVLVDIELSCNTTEKTLMETAGCFNLLSTLIDKLGATLTVVEPPAPVVRYFKDQNNNEYDTLRAVVDSGATEITQLNDYTLTDEDCDLNIPSILNGANYKMIASSNITSEHDAIFLQSNGGWIKDIEFVLNSTNIKSVIKYTSTASSSQVPSLTCENIVAQDYVISPTGYFFRGTSSTASMAIKNCNIKSGVANTYAIVRVDDTSTETWIFDSTLDSHQNTNSYANKVYNSTVACKGAITIINSEIRSSSTQLDAVCAGYKATVIDSSSIYGTGPAAIYCRNQGMITISGTGIVSGLLECTTSKVNCYTITGGTFMNFNVKWNGNESVTAAQAINGTVATTQFVKMQGGRYDIDPTSLGNTKIIDSGYTVVQDGNYWKVVAA